MKTFATFVLAMAMASAAQALALPPFPVNMKWPNTFFGLMALRSATPIHFGTVQANGGVLWIGKPASTYCPGVAGLNCSGVTTSHTTFQLSNTVLSLGVQVSGGQRIYISDCGRVSYTAAGDPAVPYGATTRGWSLEKFGQFNLLSHVNGTYFCPPTQSSTSTAGATDDLPTATQDSPVSPQTTLPGPWAFYVGVVDLPNECLYASLVAAGNDTRATAYEYD